MLEIFEFVFSSGWTFAGTVFILWMGIVAAAVFKPIQITHVCEQNKDNRLSPQKYHPN